MNFIDRLYLSVGTARPEGVSVLALTDDERLARAVGPLLAHELHPGRRYGEVLHVERVESGFEVVVRDLGAAWRPNPSGNGTLG